MSLSNLDRGPESPPSDYNDLYENDYMSTGNTKKRVFSFKESMGGLKGSRKKHRTSQPQLATYKKNHPLSKVVRAKNLQYFNTTNEILNLFSCFGDIKKIQFLHNQKYAFIEFVSIESATEAILHLNKVKLGQNSLLLEFSKNHQELNLDKYQCDVALMHNEPLLVP